jgi:hypothetical protein
MKTYIDQEVVSEKLKIDFTVEIFSQGARKWQ